jgi:hypothetical protein
LQFKNDELVSKDNSTMNIFWFSLIICDIIFFNFT